jgi:hypothetical protein
MNNLFILIAFAAVALSLLHIFLVDFNNNKGEEFYNNNSCKQIHDIFSFLPDLSNNYYLVLFLNIQFLLIVFLPFKGIAELSILFLVIMIIRHVFVNLTILPPLTEIKHKDNNLKYIFGGDYDKIFSGHFAFGFLLTLFLYKYKIITNIYLLIFYNIFNAFLILSTKSHYTIDVVISFVVTLLVYISPILAFVCRGLSPPTTPHYF